MFAECKKTLFLKIRIKMKIIIIIWNIVILFTRKQNEKIIFCVFAEFDSGLNL